MAGVPPGGNKLNARPRYGEVFSRIGSGPKKQMQWLLRFQGEEMPAKSAEEWERLRQEVMAFQLFASGRPVEVLASWPVPEPSNTRKAEDAVWRLRDITARIIRDLGRLGRAELPAITKIPLQVSRIQSQTEPSLTIGDGISFAWPERFLTASSFEHGVTDPFLLQLARVLSRFASKVFICKAHEHYREFPLVDESPKGITRWVRRAEQACSTPFLAHKMKQVYCSDRCRSLIAMKRWRVSQKDRNGKPSRRPIGGFQSVKKTKSSGRTLLRKGEAHHGKTRR